MDKNNYTKSRFELKHNKNKIQDQNKIQLGKIFLKNFYLDNIK